jgi:hypothetical protein
MCDHPSTTVPGQLLRIIDKDQQILFEAKVQVCLGCGHTTGTANNGSMFHPIEFGFEGTTYELAITQAREKYQALASVS